MIRNWEIVICLLQSIESLQALICSLQKNSIRPDAIVILGYLISSNVNKKYLFSIPYKKLVDQNILLKKPTVWDSYYISKSSCSDENRILEECLTFRWNLCNGTWKYNIDNNSKNNCNFNWGLLDLDIAYKIFDLERFCWTWDLFAWSKFDRKIHKFWLLWKIYSCDVISWNYLNSQIALIKKS